MPGHSVHVFNDQQTTCPCPLLHSPLCVYIIYVLLAVCVCVCVWFGPFDTKSNLRLALPRSLRRSLLSNDGTTNLGSEIFGSLDVFSHILRDLIRI